MKYILISIAAVLLIGVGAFFLLNTNTPEPSEAMDKELTMMESGDEAMTQNDDDSMMMSEPGAYVEYSADTYANYEGQKRVLFFYANWCPTCRPVDQQLTSREDEIPSGVTIIRVNYNDNATDSSEDALADEYGVTYQHTFVVLDENNEVITKYNGGDLDKVLSTLN